MNHVQVLLNFIWFFREWIKWQFRLLFCLIKCSAIPFENDDPENKIIFLNDKLLRLKSSVRLSFDNETCSINIEYNHNATLKLCYAEWLCCLTYSLLTSDTYWLQPTRGKMESMIEEVVGLQQIQDDGELLVVSKPI